MRSTLSENLTISDGPVAGAAKAIALVDCNNFYVSCERVFQPHYNNKPVVVLSNNDGCVISRSDEAKKAGIRMGVPIHEVMPLIEAHHIKMFSANFALYGDFSHRVMTSLAQFSPQVELYSVDEAFIDLSGIGVEALDAYGRAIRQSLLQWVKLPVSVGIAETKTLAKVAAEHAKKSKKAQGVLNLVQSPFLDVALGRLPVSAVWGVGWKTTEKLERRGIKTALQLRDIEDAWVMKHFGVVLMRTVYELRGIPCIPLDLAPAPKKNILTSRSFARAVETLADVKKAVASYTACTAEKLRTDGLATQNLMVYIQTKRFREGAGAGQYGNSTVMRLPVATQSTQELIGYALRGLEQIFRPGYQYKKAGVMALDLVPSDQIQQNLLDRQDRAKEERLMKAMDGINRNFGSGTLRYAVEGLEVHWWRRQEHLSPRFTTRWQDIPLVQA